MRSENINIKVDIDASNYRKWLNKKIVSSLFSGVVLGVIIVCCVSAEHYIHTLILITIYFARLSTSSSYLGVHFPTYLAFALPPTLLLIAKFLYIGGEIYYIGSGLTLLYFTLISSLARYTHSTVKNTSELTYEKNELVANLFKQKEMAESAVLAKSQFLAAASHDLRQPLHAQGLFVTAFQYLELTPEAKKLASKIQLSTEALNKLLDGLLDISRFDANAVKYEPSCMSLNLMLNKIAQEYFDRAADKESVINLNIDLDINVYCDETLLYRLVRNLIDNAVKFTSDGVITIQVVESQGNDIMLCISDTGIGIPEAEQNNVFTEFTQLDNPERDRQKGLGLGLAIVKRLSDLMGINLTMESEYGVGTNFSIPLSLCDIEPASQTIDANDKQIEDDLISLRDEVIVVIDDEIEILEGMKMIFHNWQTTIITATSVESAINHLKKRNLRPSLVMADFRLRDNRTGIGAIKKLRNQYSKELRAILVTGDTSPNRLALAHSANLPILHKPVSPKVLRKAIDDLLRIQD